MGRQISMATRQELVGAIRVRYAGSSRVEKRKILDEFVAVTGYHHKSAIRVLTASPVVLAPVANGRPRRYDAAVREALVVLWEASDRVCGKRLKALLQSLVEAMERHGHLQLDTVVRERLLSASAATLDRLLAPTRVAARGHRRRRWGAASSLRRNVPVRTFADWKDPPPGFFEADLVSHCGGTAAGSFVHTLTLTDIASGWTECFSLVVRAATLVVEALKGLRDVLPFPLLGFDTDNGSEFINETVFAYCQEQHIEFTRSRPYRKNDQAWVEQKNGAVVRKLVGYDRLEGLTAAATLARLYAASRLFVNFFQPSFKLASKTRVGARVVKRYHPPATPCERLLASASVPEAAKATLREVAAGLDPIQLLEQIRAAQRELMGHESGDASPAVVADDAELGKFLRSLPTAWEGGEVRPTHRAPPTSPRHWRTRVDPFDAVWPEVRMWLEAEPDRTAKELLERLGRESSSTFPANQLRTLQRRVKAWRQAEAERLLLTAPTSLHTARATRAASNGNPTLAVAVAR